MYGCLPGTFRVAGLVQYRGWSQPPNSELRFYGSGEIIQQHGDFTQTGDFFPALQQLAGTTWQQIAAGGPDAYKVDCAKIERMWRDWFSALYSSAMEQGHGDYLLPYLARKVHGEWRLGANASGIYRPMAPNGDYVPLVTPGTFKDGRARHLEDPNPCWFTDGSRTGSGGPSRPHRSGRETRRRASFAHRHRPSMDSDANTRVSRGRRPSSCSRSTSAPTR
jgi:hypothetical protein